LRYVTAAVAVLLRTGRNPGPAGGKGRAEFSAGEEKVPAENGRKMRKVVLFYCLFGWNDYFCKTGLG